jgi:hypothetical protein
MRAEKITLTIALAFGCARGSVVDTASPARSGTAPSETTRPPQPAVEGPRAETRELDVITDPATLIELERRGLGLLELLGAPAYASLATTLEADIEAVRRSDRAAGVGVAKFAHRLFDVRWLYSETARFELVGVVNRLDRAGFRADSCGETRLVYRLAYTAAKQGVEQSSRLPMTIGLEFRVPKTAADPSCREAAERWFARGSTSTAEHLRSPDGPLHPSLLRRATDDLLVVVNVQQVRWPSTVRPALGGHAEYSLRAFRFDGQGKVLSPAALENTPDVARLKKEPGLRSDLKRFLREPEVLSQIDRGTLLLPDSFSASRAVSVTPRGLARLGNRPFSQLFSAADFADLRFDEGRFVRSPKALLRRLDQLSCQGCHEARSVAGFHLLGQDTAETPAENALAVALSPHLLDDLPRRRALASEARAGRPLDLAQPFAEHPEQGAGAYGAHCGLGADPSFAGWTCRPGLACSPYDAADDGVGQCLPEASGQAGDPCEVGTVTRDADVRRDGARDVRKSDCAPNAVCNTNAVGFPGGMCTEGCAGRSESAICGSIAVLDPFNACLARQEPFSKCLTENVRPAGLRACGPESHCRDDYICAGARGRAACIPPYFLFQMRVDGHP